MLNEWSTNIVEMHRKDLSSLFFVATLQMRCKNAQFQPWTLPAVVYFTELLKEKSTLISWVLEFLDKRDNGARKSGIIAGKPSGEPFDSISTRIYSRQALEAIFSVYRTIFESLTNIILPKCMLKNLSVRWVRSVEQILVS